MCRRSCSLTSACGFGGTALTRTSVHAAHQIVPTARVGTPERRGGTVVHPLDPSRRWAFHQVVGEIQGSCTKAAFTPDTPRTARPADASNRPAAPPGRRLADRPHVPPYRRTAGPHGRRIASSRPRPHPTVASVEPNRTTVAWPVATSPRYVTDSVTFSSPGSNPRHRRCPHPALLGPRQPPIPRDLQPDRPLRCPRHLRRRHRPVPSLMQRLSTLRLVTPTRALGLRGGSVGMVNTTRTNAPAGVKSGSDPAGGNALSSQARSIGPSLSTMNVQCSPWLTVRRSSAQALITRSGSG
jgi:hypothetical protein